MQFPLQMGRRLLVEGPPGSGKTEPGKTLVEGFDTELIISVTRGSPRRTPSTSGTTPNNCWPYRRGKGTVADGVSFAEGAFDALYTPIGLDLGGGSPYQIAHSIVAELLAVENDREPTHLREREGHIHDRVEADAAGGDAPVQ